MAHELMINNTGTDLQPMWYGTVALVDFFLEIIHVHLVKRGNDRRYPLKSLVHANSLGNPIL